MTETFPANHFGLPEPFYIAIRPYISKGSSDTPDTPKKLVTLWMAALSARQAHPELEELIAEWAMSAAASSPLVNDNDVYEDIHARFGRLEVPGDTNQEDWEELDDLINSLDIPGQ